MDAASNLKSSRLVLLALGAAGYSAVRLVEAYGLFYEKAWAEVLAAGSGAIYLPLEIFHVIKHPTGLDVLLFLLNVAVVAIMVRALLQRRKVRSASGA